MASSSALATKIDSPAPVSPPAGIDAQQSYSGTPRGPDGTTQPDDYALEMADPLRRMEIFEEMRASDDGVDTAIDARRQEINAANWVLGSEDKSDRGTEILEFVEDNLYPVLDDLLRWIGGGGIQYGFAAIEPVFAWSDRPFAGMVARGKVRRPTRRGDTRRIYLRKLAHIRQRAIETFKISEQGDLQTVIQYAFNGTSYRRTEIRAEKLLLWTYDRQGDDRWGVPPTRHCYKAWTFKTQIEKLNILHTDRFAVGMPVVEEGDGWTQSERISLAAFMRTWRASGTNYLLHPKGGKITVVADDGKTTMSMLEWVRYYNLAIAKTFLTQGTELGSTETGARALGETFFEQMGGLVQADCEEIASLLNEVAIKRLVDWNYGEQENYPVFEPSQRVKGGAGVGTALKQLIDCGAVHVRPEDEAFLRDVYGLPSVAVETLKEEGATRVTPPATGAAIADRTQPSPAPDSAPAALPADGTPAGDQNIQVTQATVLNGAQISSAKDIVLAVVAGQLPRDTGVAMLQVFFNLTPEKADQIMGAAGTKTPTTPNPVAGAPSAQSGAPGPAAAGGAGGAQPTPGAAERVDDPASSGRPPLKVAATRAHPHARQLALAEGAPEPAVPGATSYRTPDLTSWEHGILRPDVLIRDLDLATSRLAGEVQDVLTAIDDDLERQAAALAGKGAGMLSGGVRDIAVPDRLRKQLRAVLYEAAQRARDYGAKAVRNEIQRQIGPEGIGPQRDSWWPTTLESPSFYARALLRIRALIAGEPDATPRDLHLAAEVDRAVEEEVSRRESSIRSSILTALAQAAGAAAAALAVIVSTASKATLVGLSTGRTESNVQGVVNVGFGIGRSDAADAITNIDAEETAQPAGEGSGGGTRSGLRDSDGNAVELVGKIYSAVMDLGTCDECAKWDGAEFPIDYPEDYTGVQAPNPRCAGGYARCRCVWIYLTSRESIPLVPAAKGPAGAERGGAFV